MTDQQKVDAILNLWGGDMSDQDERAAIERVVANSLDVVSILLTEDEFTPAHYPACDDSQQAAFKHRGVD